MKSRSSPAARTSPLAAISTAEESLERQPPAPDRSLTELYSLRPSAIWSQLKREHISFWFVCGYLLFEYVRPQTIYPAIDVLPWASLFVIAALGTSFFDKTAAIRGSSLTKFLVAYGVVVLLSGAFGYNSSHSFANLDAYFNWLIIYFTIIRTVRTKTRFFIFFTLYMLCNFKMSQHGFLSWAMRGFSFAGYGVTGSPGWFQNSGEFGIQLCIFTPLIIAFILAVRPYCGKLVRLVLYIIPFTAIGSAVATNSRGALIGLAGAALFSVKMTKHFIRTSVVIACVGVGVYYAIPQQTLQRFESSGTDRTSLVRIDRWQKGWDTMKEHPVLGIGHKNWEGYYSDNLNYGIEGTALVHNIFIESGTEHGFLGLGILVLLLLYMFVVNSRIRKAAKAQNDTFAVYIAHGLDAATVGMVISSFFITVLYYPYVWIQAAFIAALEISVVARARQRTNSSKA